MAGKPEPSIVGAGALPALNAGEGTTNTVQEHERIILEILRDLASANALNASRWRMCLYDCKSDIFVFQGIAGQGRPDADILGYMDFYSPYEIQAPTDVAGPARFVFHESPASDSSPEPGAGRRIAILIENPLSTFRITCAHVRFRPTAQSA